MVGKIKIGSKKEFNAIEKERLQVLREVLNYKLPCEANIVSILYKKPQLFESTNLSLCDISNNIWKVYFSIAYELYKVEKKTVLDDMTVGFFLEKHNKLKEQYDKYGGYTTIEKSGEYISTDNFDGYLEELKKWNIVLQLIKENLVLDKNKIKEFIDCTADDIYEEYECIFNNIFIKSEGNIKSFSLSDGIYDLINELDMGLAVGLPYHNMPMLTNETGGQYMGSITLVGGLSNVGKSAFLRHSTIPSIIENNEKIVIMLNEDGLKKWQREFLVYVANNILKEELHKQTVRDGSFEDNTKELLRRAADWIVEKSKDNTITIVPFTNYKTSNVIKVLNKYISMGVKYFALDTYKMDAGVVSNNAWLQMQQGMVQINDVVKPESKNVHILITFQLAKGSVMQRYYTQDNIGMAKNIIDPASTCIMIRTLFDDERPGGKRVLQVYKRAGKNGKSEVPVKLESNKHYQILFIPKNREGAANEYQIVVEHDLSKNTLKEVGYTYVPMDF